ncbi:hypothetical protein EYF80_038469 [Liparis tanakae]|uniref:Uncharacterized protein n=1 Tax=Liparis tanakae TaxID=230148 RepID=A0A4Z2GDU6_9TELE|nr:hypothetical protein EYF80_038469 [Liparis tanakae]
MASSVSSSDGQDGALPLPPLPLLNGCLARGVCEEHHVLFALDLSLEELERRAVEAHHVLNEKRRGSLIKKVFSPDARLPPPPPLVFLAQTHSDLLHLLQRVAPQLVHHRQQHLVTGDRPEAELHVPVEQPQQLGHVGEGQHQQGHLQLTGEWNRQPGRRDVARRLQEEHRHHQDNVFITIMIKMKRILIIFITMMMRIIFFTY